MFIENFYDYDFGDEKEKIEHFYTCTLSAYLIYNDLQIFDNLLIYFEEKEEYLICQAIKEALEKVESIIEFHFANPPLIEDDGEEVYIYDHEEHKNLSRLVFEDIIKEIYERQIRRNKASN